MLTVLKNFLFRWMAPLMAGGCATAAGAFASANVPMALALGVAATLLIAASLPLRALPPEPAAPRA